VKQTQHALLTLLREHGPTTTRHLATITGRPQASINNSLHRLQARNLAISTPDDNPYRDAGRPPRLWRCTEEP